MTDTPRIRPLAPEDRDEKTRELLSSMQISAEGDTMNLFSTLAHHPALLKRWSQFGGKLLFGGRLSHRDREVLILRTAANTGAEYEWGHHQGLARGAGLTSEEIDALAGPLSESDDTIGPEDALLVRAADELHAHQVLSDDTWAALAERYDEQQLIEICMVVGQYHMVAFTARSLGVQLEAGYEGFPS